MAVNGPIYMRLMFAGQLLFKNSCTKFHENSTNDLIADTKSDVDGCTDRLMVRCLHTRHSLLVCKEPVQLNF